MKKEKQPSVKNKSSFNLRRRKLNIGASVHVLPSKLALQEAYNSTMGLQKKGKRKGSKNQFYSQTNDSIHLSKQGLTKGRDFK